MFRGDTVQKEELLHLHMLLIQIKKFYETHSGEEINAEKYSSLLVSPVHIHKNKILHKKAILTLGEEIVHHIHQRDFHQSEVHMVGYVKEIPSGQVLAEH